MSEAVALHLRWMREDGLSIPNPVSNVEYVEAVARFDYAAIQQRHAQDAQLACLSCKAIL